MVALSRRHNKWRGKVRVPKELQGQHDGKQFLYKTLEAADRFTARLEGKAWELQLKALWEAQKGPSENPAKRLLRQHYETLLEQALGGHFDAFGRPSEDPTDLGLSLQMEKLAEEAGQVDLNPEQQARLAALQDAREVNRGNRPARRKELEPSFSESAVEYVDIWATQHGLKKSNTRPQKEATFRLFAGYVGDKPLREVTRPDAAGFKDALRRMDPNWARSSIARKMSWRELQETFGGHPKGLTASTMNRHMTALQELWKWGEDRDRCGGRNPFSGMRDKIKPGVNLKGYLPWEPAELQQLLDPAPARKDLEEIMRVSLFSGMRINEIASLTFSQIREVGGVDYIQIEGAKTPAGNRQVPLHSALSWLAERKGKAAERVWPEFNSEGPGKKPGEDASKVFGDFKRGRGFTGREKAFHSFRKNVTQIMERAKAPENEWAQVLGHERGLTYGRYSPHGITLPQKAELIELIAYPEVPALK